MTNNLPNPFFLPRLHAIRHYVISEAVSKIPKWFEDKESKIELQNIEQGITNIEGKE